jgi:hypothetical protein
MKNIVLYFAKKYPNRFTHLAYLIVCRPSGLKPPKKDDRDLNTAQLGWRWFGAYTPKHTRHINPTLSVKNQGTFNTCVFNGSAVMHEPNEQIKLESESILINAKQDGLITGTGLTDIRTGFKMMQKYGIAREGILPGEAEKDWTRYSGAKLTPEIVADAATRKIQTYWLVTSHDDIIKLLDEGKILGTGIPWYTAFNMGGGFSYPWLITKFIGWLIGGHFATIKGYDLEYQNRQTYVIQNTYGAGWGANGDYYIDMAFLEKNDYGIYAILDVPLDMAKFYTDYDGKNIKGKTGSTIYFLQKGVKKPYLHEMDYFVWNVNDPKMLNFSVVDDAMLAKVPQGDNMDITKSDAWPVLQHLDQPLNMTRVLEALANAKI